MTDYAQRVTEIVEAFERGEIEDTWEQHATESSKFKGPMVKNWWPTLDGWIGRTRRVTQSMRVTDDPPTARAVLSGESGEAVVTILFDDDGKITNFGVTDWPLILGIRNVQIDCPGGTVPQIAKLYAALLGIPFPEKHEPNWIVIAKDRWTKPSLPFAGQAPEWKPAAWGDPGRQQQMHLEFFVRDMSEASGLVEAHGATRVDDDVWLDPAGHAIRLEPGASGDVPGVIARIVLDCDDPRALAPFYEELLGMTNRVEDAPDRVVIAYEGGPLPMLTFRRVPGHSPPRWPDPEHPQQMHIDMMFEDSHAAMRVAERLGAVRLPPPVPWSHPDVYADPAGHPFCLGFPGQ